MNEFIVREMFENLFEKPFSDPKIIGKYFTDDYQQEVDQQILNRQEFEQHLIKLRSKVESFEIQILNAAEKEDLVFTKHLVKSTLNTGEKLVFKVFAAFTFEGNKIKFCDELTTLIQGNSNEKRLGAEI